MPALQQKNMETWQVVRDRVLLYVRAMDLPPFEGLEIALESLKQANTYSIEEAMNSLAYTIEKRGLNKGVLDAQGEHIASIPSMNRGVMVSKNFDRTPWLTALKIFIHRWTRDLFGPSRTR